ncbi:MAG: glutathione S-transferase family protein [Maricaulaceae bacterium]
MTLTFYDYKMAPSPRRARIILAEKNVPHDAVQIDMMTGAQFTEDYRKINPNCTIPALRLEDGNVLTDNAGIAIYLEEAFPEPPLLGRTALEKAEIATWQSKIEFGLAMPAAHAFRNGNPAMKNRALPGPHNYEQIPALIERGLKQIDDFMVIFNAHMDGREFIVGDNFSVVDITAACTFDFAKAVGKRITDDTPHTKRWKDGLNQRPAFKL